MKNPAFVEVGTHGALRNMNEDYAKIWKLQAEAFVEVH